jgi:uncharacterized protein
VSLRDLWGQLRGRDHRSVHLLHDQLDHALAGLYAVRAVVTDELDAEAGRAAVVRAERAGDHARETIVAELTAAIAPPLDREDLFRVSRSIDDVLDNLRDFARERVLLAVEDGAPFVPMVDAIGEALELLRDAVDELDGDLAAFPRAVLAAKKASNQIRRSYDEALAALLVDPVDAATLRTRELLRRLDVVGLRLGEATDALADGAVKRSH